MSTAQEKQPPQKVMVLPLREYEATLNPSDFDEEPAALQQANRTDQPQPPIDISKDSVVIHEEVVQGFRIQLFSSSSIDEATATKEEAALKFISDSIYIVFDAPVYKVRVGDFISRYEANQRLPEFIAQGFRDAWVVPDRVIQRKVLRVAPGH
ncbi:MAG TPA: SPOR domain-containing protein [Bacteroidota bacterium]|nr:SPOR domain-containing protein [Bacteroidota bacterium]